MSALQELAIDLEAERAGGEAAHDRGNRPRDFSGMTRWFGSLSIGRKISLFFFVNLGFALVAGIFIVFGFMRLSDRAESINVIHDHAIAASELGGRTPWAGKGRHGSTLRPSSRTVHPIQ